ncbi:hypothetical protein [Ligilactobacillus salivarius]|uniref:BppU N-terminal domain-containing protein n=1 Tax=Ligilactobacillus salivarius TaxID=1624 RepID=A0A2U2M7M5_9LACO|nr:hypothetical protein [Ligilactobacillus salivarius]PWG52858.1 hypothetical protein DB362_02775 [Ligilactobacillus salivarius]
MKTLTINQKVFKHQDTQTKLKITLFSDDSRVSLDSDADYQLKIKNASGYLKSEALTIEDNRLVLTTDKFKDLTPDTYNFEVWENEDSIYPSDSYGYFKITKNVSEVDGETIPVITIEDFEKRFAEAVKNAKGDKGERGADGRDGKSAYQIWLDLGNSGTEQDFINSLKVQSEQHAPTGWSLDVSTKPWTVWFDNGVGLQFPDFYNNTTVHSDSVIGSLIKLSNNTFALAYGFKKVWDIGSNWGKFKSYITSKTIVINPVNTKIKDWDNRNYGITLADPMPGNGGYPLYKAGDIVRVLYGLGIVNDAILENMDKTMPDEYTWFDKWM